MHPTGPHAGPRSLAVLVGVLEAEDDPVERLRVRTEIAAAFEAEDDPVERLLARARLAGGNGRPARVPPAPPGRSCALS